jgi:hypothetical protein
MALNAGLQPAARGSRSRSGFSVPVAPKGRWPTGTRHLTCGAAPDTQIGLPRTGRQRLMPVRRAGACTETQEA